MQSTVLLLDSVIATSPDQVSCDLQGEAAILSLQNGKYYTLNPVGARIWSVLSVPTTVRAICDLIVQEYDVEHETCLADVQVLLQDLAQHGLIAVQESSKSSL